MACCRFSVRWPVLVVATMAAVSSAQAQRPATNGWQPIIFSTPDNAEISSNLDSLSARPPSNLQTKLQLLQDSSPVSALNDAALSAPPPSPMPFFQKPSDSQQQWEFMTPAQILGVAPDQILQTRRGDSSTNSDLSSLSPMERHWFEGQDSFDQFQTNSANTSFRQQNLWGNEGGQTNSSSSGFFGNAFGGWLSNASGPFLGNALNDNSSAGPDGDIGWPRIFGSPASQPISSPVQQQPQMNQFMQLLNQNSPDDTPSAGVPDQTSFKSQIALPNSDSAAPLANSIGASFAPINSGIAQPAGLMPLPTLTQPAGVQSVAPPAWAPQPPPWMSSAPQPFTVPQRKF